jgi:hypothetical protein
LVHHVTSRPVPCDVLLDLGILNLSTAEKSLMLSLRYLI